MSRTDHDSATSTHGGGAVTSTRHWALVPYLATTIALLAMVRPIRDVDSYWHVLIGYDIVNHRRFTGDPDWTFGPHHPWTTTQWGSEVLFAGLHHLIGWRGLTIFALTCLAAILVATSTLIRQSTGLRVTSHPALGALFMVVALCASIDTHERPAALSFLLLLLVAHWAFHGMESGRWPRWWAAGLLSLIWAQFHGYWVMLPAVLTIAALLRALDMRTTAHWRPPFFAALAATLAGAITPAGLYGFQAPLVFRQSATPFISEWSPTALAETPTTALGLALAALTVTAWAKAPRPVPARWIIWCCLWTLFAAAAYRNLTPAILLVVPVTAASIARAWPRPPVIAGDGRLSLMAARTLTLAAGIGLVVSLATVTPIPATAPTGIIATIDQTPGERRVLNDYDLGGQLLALTGDHVRVAVDGRSDRYRRDTLDPYFAMMRLAPGWDRTLAAYAPTDIILREDYALAQMLPSRGWRPVQQEGRYTLWRQR